jgi:pSer/pThr/pTyr-binding forkhead associated (FHA) protein
MKVQLIVVRGKPEGKVIPLAGPKFKIGRSETCHLRPNSEQVSREHAEFTIEPSAVIVRDLGSRNGTFVNGKALTTEPCKLKDRDLVQVGPLTFAVSIPEAPALSVKPAPATPPAQAKKTAPDEIAPEDIDSWLLGDPATLAAEEKSKVYGGERITIAAFKDTARAPAARTQPTKPLSSADDAGFDGQTEADDDELGLSETKDDEAGEDDEDAESGPSLEDELMDPSNPFYAAKKAQNEKAKAAKAAPGAGSAGKRPVKDTSDAANEILRKLMERRRGTKP